MRRWIARAGAVNVLFIIVLAALAHDSSAYTVSAEPNIVTRGSAVEFIIMNGSANETASFVWALGNVVLFQQDVILDQNGTFSGTYQLPYSLDPGIYTVWVRIGSEQQKLTIDVRYTDRERYILDQEARAANEAMLAGFLGLLIVYVVYNEIKTNLILLYMHYRFNKPVTVIARIVGFLDWIWTRFKRRQYDPYQKVIVRQHYNPLAHAMYMKSICHADAETANTQFKAAQNRAEYARKILVSAKAKLELTTDRSVRRSIAKYMNYMMNELDMAETRIHEFDVIHEDALALKASWQAEANKLVKEGGIELFQPIELPPEVERDGAA